MKVIQLRGTNATGKTTAMRQFVFGGGFCVQEINVAGRQIEYHWNEERRIAVVGRYDKNECGGTDGYIKDREELLNIIAKMLRVLRPDVLAFEGIVYGVTFQFSYDVAALARRYGYEYTAICLEPPLDVALERLEVRNGGKPVNYMRVQEKWFASARGNERLKESGVNLIVIDTSKVPKESMGMLIEGAI